MAEKTWERRKSPWRHDAAFVAFSREHWPTDLMWAARSYDRGATQRLKLRWEGWSLAKKEKKE